MLSLYTDASFARNPSSKKRMRNHNWDSPRNSQFDLMKLVHAQDNSMFRELAPSEGQSQCPATIPAFA